MKSGTLKDAIEKRKQARKAAGPEYQTAPYITDPELRAGLYLDQPTHYLVSAMGEHGCRAYTLSSGKVEDRTVAWNNLIILGNGTLKEMTELGEKVGRYGNNGSPWPYDLAVQPQAKWSTIPFKVGPTTNMVFREGDDFAVKWNDEMNGARALKNFFQSAHD